MSLASSGSRARFAAQEEEVLEAVGAGEGLDLVPVGATARMGPHGFEGIVVDARRVYVDEDAFRADRREGVEMLEHEGGSPAVAQARRPGYAGYGDPRHSGEDCLPGRGAGSRIEDVGPQIGAAIDAGNYDFRLEINGAEHREKHAIRGSPGTGKRVAPDFTQFLRIAEGDRLRDAGTLPVRSEDTHVVLPR